MPDPTYALMMLAQTFVRRIITAHAGDKQRALQQQQFEAQREDQRRQTEERRAQEWALADKQRQTNLELQENQMVLNHWPLRLFPSQILKSHRSSGPTPLRVLLSLPANGPRDLEGPVRQALQHFVSSHYNFNLRERPIELLDGAWKDGALQGPASIKALHERLRSEPTLVLETQMPEGDDFLYLNLAYWGPAQDQYVYQVLDKIPYRSMVDDAARAGARQWRQARDLLVAKGLAKDAADADARLGGVRAANLKRLEQEEALTAAEIDLNQVELPLFQFGKDDYRAIHQFMITWHCLTMSWIADLYHFAYWDASPLLPTLLPGLLHPDFPPDVARALIDHYCLSYRAVAAERPAWAPELTLQLAIPLAALPDSKWAIGEVAQAIQDWLTLRGLAAPTGTGVNVIEHFVVEAAIAEGPIGPALCCDPNFFARLREAIDRLGWSHLLETLGSIERIALERQKRESSEREYRLRELAEAERLADVQRRANHAAPIIDSEASNGPPRRATGIVESEGTADHDLPVVEPSAVMRVFERLFGARDGEDLGWPGMSQVPITKQPAKERIEEIGRPTGVDCQSEAEPCAVLEPQDIHGWSTERVGIGLFGRKRIADELMEELETLLLTADVGVDITDRIVSALALRVKGKSLSDPQALLAALKEELRQMLAATHAPVRQAAPDRPQVILILGAKGSGKTTTIGKLARYLQAEGNSVMLAAGDTFSAAAVEQLQAWGERNRVPVIAHKVTGRKGRGAIRVGVRNRVPVGAQKVMGRKGRGAIRVGVRNRVAGWRPDGGGADSASVIFDALQAATARGVDVLIADAAGRLHTKTNLIDELSKIARVMKKIDPEAPHEVLLVVDATTGQNGLNQAVQFHQAVPLTGIALTKLDGTAKGGIIFAIAEKLKVPIRFIGVGESIEDLRPFDADEFLDALLSQ